MKKIRTKTDEVSIDEHGIVHKRVLENTHVCIDAVKEAEEACKKISGTDKYLVLVDATALHTMTPEATEELKRNLDDKRIATAIVSDKLGIRILFSYLSQREGAITPVELFQDKDEAIKWLLQYKTN